MGLKKENDQLSVALFVVHKKLKLESSLHLREKEKLKYSFQSFRDELKET